MADDTERKKAAGPRPEVQPEIAPNSLLGRRGNNPYCHHRVLTLAERGIRERIVKIEDAPALPFATGRFALLEEPIPAGDIRA